MNAEQHSSSAEPPSVEEVQAQAVYPGDWLRRHGESCVVAQVLVHDPRSLTALSAASAPPERRITLYLQRPLRLGGYGTVTVPETAILLKLLRAPRVLP